MQLMYGNRYAHKFTDKCNAIQGLSFEMLRSRFKQQCWSYAIVVRVCQPPNVICIRIRILISSDLMLEWNLVVILSSCKVVDSDFYFIFQTVQLARIHAKR